MSNTAENAKLEYEAGQASVVMSALDNSGDNITFTSDAMLWSGRNGYTPVVRPDGLLTGGAVTPGASANTVAVAALTCNLAGVVTPVAGNAALSITRPATNVAKVLSITVNASGALAVVAGTDGTGTTFTETRGAAGGPAFVPVGSIEIAQVRLTSSTSAVVLAAEVFQVIGLHTERADTPPLTINHDEGSVSFLSALPAIHTGSTTRGVYASYAEPIFGEVALASDFKAPETSHSVTSTQVYGTTMGSTSQSLGQGGFTAYLDDGVSDQLVQLKNETLWFRFYPDRYKAPYVLAQGKLGVARTWPAGDKISAACTISASSPAIEVI